MSNIIHSDATLVVETEDGKTVQIGELEEASISLNTPDGWIEYE